MAAPEEHRRRPPTTASLASWGRRLVASQRPRAASRSRRVGCLFGFFGVDCSIFLRLICLLFGYLFVEYHLLNKVVIHTIVELLVKSLFGSLLTFRPMMPIHTWILNPGLFANFPISLGSPIGSTSTGGRAI